MERRLPAEVFSTFNLSSYLVWRLGERYRDFGDGRYLPFGDALVNEQRTLSHEPLDSPAWERAVRTRHIRTAIFPLLHFFALNEIPLREDCRSLRWKPVYIDTAAVIFVRNDAFGDLQPQPGTTSCEAIAQSVARSAPEGTRRRAEHYQRLLTVAAVQYLLGHLPEATATLGRAAAITTVDPTLYLQKAQIEMAAKQYDDAENDFRASLARAVTDPAWYGLGILYVNQQRYEDAIIAFRHSAALAGLQRFRRLYDLGKAYVLAGQPEKALETLAAVRANNPFLDSQVPEAAEFRAQVAEVRATAYASMGRWPDAIVEQKNALQETPGSAHRWQVLAACYRAAGKENEAAEAQRRSEALHSRATP
jgi:tetratricopeptide (TPR) repeat protein